MDIWQRRSEWPIYAVSILLVAALLATAVLVQFVFVYEEFRPRVIIVPVIVTLIVGTLIGRLAVLQRRLHQSSLAFRAIVDIAQEFTYLRRVDGQYEYVSPSCLAFTGYSQQDFLTHPSLMDALIHPEERERWRSHVHHINDSGEAESFDSRLITRDGAVRWFTHICAPVYDASGAQIGVRSTNVDITQRMEDQAHIEHMAHYDPLTDLPNRRLLERELGQRTTEEQPFAVLFLDLSRFKNINDSLGHAFGDQLLRQVARRLAGACPNQALLCRFGGDEFVIVLPQISSKTAAIDFAHQLLLTIEQPLLLAGQELHISGTVGIACFPDDGENSSTLIRNADAAMYRAKRSGHSKIATYHIDFSREAVRFVSTESDVHRALQQNEFLPHYQPKVDLHSGRIIALEALARWQHPVRGMVAPADFIAVAEETGQITQLGQQMLEHVLLDLARWRRLGCAVPVAINVSPRQFADSAFWQRLYHSVDQDGCPPELLELEITEQVFLHDMDSAGQRLASLRRRGFAIALDDFGSGYSSFNYLRRLPVSVLKLDSSFITDLVHTPTNQAILRATISLCEELELQLIAEGVETTAQRDALLKLRCRHAQGFLFHRPMPAMDIEPLLLAPPPPGPVAVDSDTWKT